MFSWICPQCGREVPPSKTDCPGLRGARAKLRGSGWTARRLRRRRNHSPGSSRQPLLAAAAGASVATNARAPGSPASTVCRRRRHHRLLRLLGSRRPRQHRSSRNMRRHRSSMRHHRRSIRSTRSSLRQRGRRLKPAPLRRLGWWASGTAVVFLLLGAGIYYFMNRSDSSTPAAASQEKAADTSSASKRKVTNPLQKYVEVGGIRMMTQDKQPVVRFVVVNHSGAEIVDLGANVTLLASTSRSDEDSVGTFSFKVPSLSSNESKELTEPLKTKLKPYELPDWQNTTAEVQITSPAQ